MSERTWTRIFLSTWAVSFLAMVPLGNWWWLGLLPALAIPIVGCYVMGSRNAAAQREWRANNQER